MQEAMDEHESSLNLYKAQRQEDTHRGCKGVGDKSIEHDMLWYGEEWSNEQEHGRQNKEQQVEHEGKDCKGERVVVKREKVF